MKSNAYVFDLYGEYFRYTGGAAKLKVLTELMGVFGVTPATVRTVMMRLRKQGWFRSAKQGREVSYILTDKGWRMLENGRVRLFDPEFDDWSNVWTQAIVDTAGMDRRQYKRIQTALSWWGFGHYRDGVWFSPHNRSRRVREMLDGDDDTHIQFLYSQTDGAPFDRMIADKCWDLDQLGVDYQQFIAQFQPRLAQYRQGLDGPAALVEQIELVRAYHQFPFRDPNLPDFLLPSGWRGGVAQDVFHACHDALRQVSGAFVSSVADKCDKKFDI